MNIVRRFFRRILATISAIFLNGLLTVLPITLTIALFNVSLKLLKGWLEPIHDMQPEIFERLPYSEIIIVLIFIFLVGTILRFFIVRSVVIAVESVLFRVPLIRPVYSGIKQLLMALSPHNKVSFQEVALVEFPRTGIFSLGFVTSKVPIEISPEKDTEFLSLFIPTTPNPTSGYFIMLPKNDVRVINITRQEAMALIISGGIIKPERFNGDD